MDLLPERCKDLQTHETNPPTKDLLKVLKEGDDISSELALAAAHRFIRTVVDFNIIPRLPTGLIRRIKLLILHYISMQNLFLSAIVILLTGGVSRRSSIARSTNFLQRQGAPPFTNRNVGFCST
ncbi:hypothetical protein ScPMuIL_004869 [Solemya velum]